MDQPGDDLKVRRGPFHQGVAEAVVAEVGLPLLPAAAGADVLVAVEELVAPVQAVDVAVELAVGVHQLVVADGDFLAGLALDPDFGPAAEVLAAVVEAGGDLLHGESVQDADGGHLRGLQDAAGGAADEGVFPGAVVKAGAVEALLDQPGVEALAAADVVVDRGAVAGGPGGVGADFPLGQVRPLHFQGEDHLGMVAPGGLFVVPDLGDVVVPAVAQHDADDVLTGAEKGGHIVGVVQDGSVEFGQAGGQDVVGDGLTVDSDHAVAQAAGGQDGGGGDLVQSEALAEQGGGISGIGGGNPFGVLQHKHFLSSGDPKSDFTPIIGGEKSAVKRKSPLSGAKRKISRKRGKFRAFLANAVLKRANKDPLIQRSKGWEAA